MNKIEKLRKIVEEKQAGKVDGTKVDLYSASAIMAVYDKLNEKNREKFLSLSVPKMARIAYSLTKMT